MEARAIARHVRLTPRKTRQVVDEVRGKRITEAYHILSLAKKRAAGVVIKAIESAVSNALIAKSDVDVDDLYVKTIFVDSGPTLKRIRPMSMGRAGKIRKRTCHLTVVVAELK